MLRLERTPRQLAGAACIGQVQPQRHCQNSAGRNGHLEWSLDGRCPNASFALHPDPFVNACCPCYSTVGRLSSDQGVAARGVSGVFPLDITIEFSHILGWVWANVEQIEAKLLVLIQVLEVDAW